MNAQKVHKWCRIGSESAHAWLGYTDQNDLVILSKYYLGGDMKSVEIGDIVAFIARENVQPAPPGVVKKAKWRADFPKLIAKKFVSPGTAEGDSAGDSAIAWKTRRENEADQFREVDFVPAHSGAESSGAH